MKYSLVASLVSLILVQGAFASTSAAASATKSSPMVSGAGPLASLDTEIFDSNESGEQKYKRALAELDSLLGTINQEIESKTGAAAAGKTSRTKREAYGGGGWGHEENSGHGWGGWAPSPPVHSYRVYHHHRPHYGGGGLTPEFLLKTALVLKGILLLGHVAAVG